MADRHKWSEYIDQVMAGNVYIEDIPDQYRGPVEHLIKMPIFDRADNILTASDYKPEYIRQAIDSLPPTIRDRVAEAARNLWRYRSRYGT